MLLDADLATLYGVETRALVQAVKRNLDRFPEDFLFHLSHQDFIRLRSQIVTSNIGRGGRRYLPYAFTEHGALMAATILNSPRAIEMSIYIVRTFVQLRQALLMNKELARKFEELARKVDSHDQAIAGILDAIRQLMNPSETHAIGFIAPAT